MRGLVEFFLKQTIFADVLAFFILVVGVLSVFEIKREVFPNVNFDIITVTTIFPGASAEETEKMIISPLERDLKEVDGIKKMTSVTGESRGYIVLQLDPDQTTERKAKSDIQDVVDQFDFPAEAEDPVVTSVESKNTPIIEITVAGDLPELELRTVAKEVENEIERIAGVAKVVPKGMRDLEIRVEASPTLLSRFRVSLDEVVRALSLHNKNIPGGTIEASKNPDSPDREKLVRTIGEFENEEDILKTVIRANDLGQVIQVKDLATARLQLAKANTLNGTDGYPSINLTVLKKERADVIEMVEKVKVKVAEIQERLKDRGVKLAYVNDFSMYVKRRLGVLSSNLLVGLFLVVLILSLILPGRVAALVSLAIPFSFLGTMIVFEQFGLSINLISMLGLIIVSGMLVDNAIVVTDNCVRHMEEGGPSEKAIITGVLEVWQPVFASVMTTAVAFLPMLFMSGIFGKFIKQIPMGVLIALGISLLQAFFIIPAYIGRWVRVNPKDVQREVSNRKTSNFLSKLTQYTQNIWNDKITPSYVSILRKSLQRRYLVALGVTGILVLSLMLAAFKMKLILFPPDGIENFFVRIEAPVGSSLEQTKSLLKPVEEQLRELPTDEWDNFVTTVGIIQQDPNDPNTKRGSQYGQIAVYLSAESKRERSADEIIAKLKADIGQLKGVERLTFDRVNPGPPVGKPISVAIQGKEYSDILPAIEQLTSYLKTIDGVLDLTDTYTLGKEELRIKIDPKEAAAASLTVADIGTSVRAAFEGLVATSIQKLEDEVDVRVMYPESDRKSAAVLETLLIPNRFQNLIPLEQVARIEKTQSVDTFHHEDNKREVRVLGEVDTDKTSAREVAAKVIAYQSELLKNHPNVSLDFGGEEEDTQESLMSLFRAFGIAAMTIFLILVMTFKQLLQPVIVILTLPLGIIAVILTLFLHGKPLSFLAMLGIIALGGVIVNNAIVFVDFINKRREMGEDRFQSIVSAAGMRLRPIVLTTLTTVAGLMPTAYGIGGSDPFVKPIALGLGWGLFIGSLLTAFVIPNALAITDDISLFFGRLFKRKA
ncbi:MAG: hypothetical protein COT74_09355 [Bdellovibrionales bacterium CG10_big_fil_rev_8_21_14_0_10_45_34]|nr:MAG: hypothetical protein COT74_09355 [Bdellovibrionales bacterium CG10_big_fil_rev_8_21_14_0_10_45_34]